MLQVSLVWTKSMRSQRHLILWWKLWTAQLKRACCKWWSCWRNMWVLPFETNWPGVTESVVSVYFEFESRYSHTKERAVDGRSRVQFLAQTRDFSVFQNIQTDFGAPLASYSLSARSKAASSEVDHWPLSSTKVMVEWICTSSISVCVH